MEELGTEAAGEETMWKYVGMVISGARAESGEERRAEMMVELTRSLSLGSLTWSQRWVEVRLELGSAVPQERVMGKYVGIACVRGRKAVRIESETSVGFLQRRDNILNATSD